MTMRRNLPVREGEQHFRERRHPGRRFEMADVGFHRPHQQRILAPSRRTVRRGERVDLDRIAECGTGAMCFHVIHGVGREPGLRQRSLHHGLLRGPTRHRESAARSILIHRRTANHPEDPVAGILRGGQALEHHHAAPLPACIAVRAGVKRLAPPIRGEHVRLRKRGHDVRGKHQVHAADDGLFALRCAQRLTGNVQRHQRR